jgi:hypothetical protein
MHTLYTRFLEGSERKMADQWAQSSDACQARAEMLARRDVLRAQLETVTELTEHAMLTSKASIALRTEVEKAMS